MMSQNRYISLLTWGFGIWFVATVAGQKLWRAEGRHSWWDRAHLVLPDWRFFAPDPGVYDHHILIRTCSAGGHLGTWQEITEVVERRPIHAVWHPEHREEKALFDVCAELFRFIERHRKEGTNPQELAQRVQLSVAYLTLLNFASGRAREMDGTDIQFMVALSGGHDKESPEIVFVSERHDFATRPVGRRDRPTRKEIGESS